MKVDVYSIHDEKAASFGQPFYMVNRALAIRAFSDLAQDRSSSVSKHPSDYKLYKVAEFDDQVGSFLSLPQPEFVAHGSDYVNP